MITIYDLALYRWKLLGLENEPSTLANFDEVQLPIWGGCEVCGASVAAFNSCPSKSGYIRCEDECIRDTGWITVEEANAEIFSE